ncbi:MAG: hypothetical protein VYE68_02755 [Acidobacteriota bacterium]|nr:hypothetical protein [Acidobacteriota bacterium]
MAMTRTQRESGIPRRQASTLRDQDIRTVQVDRRSFLAKAVAAGSVGLGAAMTAACPSGGDTTDSDSEE